MFNKICIIGLGLIGGAIALDFLKRDLCNTIIGWDKPEVLETAKILSIIDESYLDLESSVKDVDLVIIATPVKAIIDVLTVLKPLWNKNTIYIDVGSTKQVIVNHVLDIFENIPNNLILTHPIAGSEKSGVESATHNLFQDKNVILTPIYKPNKAKFNKIKKMWELLGANVLTMSSGEHDELLAYTSHLPQLIAFIFMNQANTNVLDSLQGVIGTGFKDFTRLAASNPEMWTDVILVNKHNISRLLEQFIIDLSTVNDLIKDDNSTSLNYMFKLSNQIKRNLK